MCLFYLCGKKNIVITNQELELIEDRVKDILKEKFALINNDKKNKKRHAFNKLKDNYIQKIEEDNLKKKIEEDNLKKKIEEEKDICIICENICRKIDITTVLINNIKIYSCNKCIGLSEDDIMLWFNRKQFNREKDFEKTIKVKKNNFVLVKYKDETLDDAIYNFIKSVGIDNNYHIKIKNLL